MNNEYYLQRIYNEAQITNENLENILQQNTQISGDIGIIINQNQNIYERLNNIRDIGATIIVAIMLCLLYKFIERCFKN